jgi:hypothetical protein
MRHRLTRNGLNLPHLWSIGCAKVAAGNNLQQKEIDGARNE